MGVQRLSHWMHQESPHPQCLLPAGRSYTVGAGEQKGGRRGVAGSGSTEEGVLAQELQLWKRGYFKLGWDDGNNTAALGTSTGKEKEGRTERGWRAVASAFLLPSVFPGIFSHREKASEEVSWQKAWALQSSKPRGGGLRAERP